MKPPRTSRETAALILGGLVLATLPALVLIQRAPRAKAYRWTSNMLGRLGLNLSVDFEVRAFALEAGLERIQYSSKSAKDLAAFGKAVRRFHSDVEPLNPRFYVVGPFGTTFPNGEVVVVSKETEAPLRRYLRDRGFVTH